MTPGCAGDSPVLPRLLDELRVARAGRGRPRTTPDALRGDKAYSSRGTRALLRRRGSRAVIAERCFSPTTGWGGLATRYDKHAPIYRGAPVPAAIMLWFC